MSVKSRNYKIIIQRDSKELTTRVVQLLSDVDVLNAAINQRTYALTPEMFGAVDGVDDQVQINAAIEATATAGGGRVIFNNRNYTTSAPVILRSGVQVDMNGATVTLADGANCNVFEGQDYQTLTGTNSGAGISAFKLGNGVIDGNRAGNLTAGHGVAVYGRDFLIHDLLVKQTRDRGVTTEYGNTSVGVSPFNGRVENVTTDTTGQEGWYNSVSDVQSSNVNIRSCSWNLVGGYDGVVFAAGTRWNLGAIWWSGEGGSRMRYGIRSVNGGCEITNVNVETATVAALRLEGGRNLVMGGYFYNNQGAAHIEIASSFNKVVGCILNRASFGNPAAGTVKIVSGVFNEIDVTSEANNGPLLEVVSPAQGKNTIRVKGYQSTPNLIAGTPHSQDSIELSSWDDGNVEQDYVKVPMNFNGITATGTDRASAASIVRSVNRVVGADGTKGVVMPTGVEGRKISLTNVTSSVLLVYPAAGQQMHTGAVDAAFSMSGNSNLTLIFGGGRWMLW